MPLVHKLPYWFVFVSVCMKMGALSRCYGSILAGFLQGYLIRSSTVANFGILKNHDDVIKWKYCRRYLPFVRGIHQSPLNSPHKGQWRGAFLFSLICAWINRVVHNRLAGDLRRHRAHYDVIVMIPVKPTAHNRSTTQQCSAVCIYIGM